MKLPEYRLEHPDFVGAVISHRPRRDALLESISATVNRNKRRWLIRSFLSDPGLKLLYLLESVQHKGMLGEFHPEQLRAIAQELSAQRPIFEPVTPVNLRSGSSGRRRTTYNFGPRRHALQRMASDIVVAICPIPPERHFTIIGGVRKALLAVQGHAQQGFVYAVERDIEQFYPNVDLQGLATLLRPLPASVVMNVLAYRPGYRPSDAGHSAEAVGDAPLPLRGLLAQGSAASPVAAEVIMADLLREMPDNVRVMSYADNVLILGETLDSASAASAFLEARASEHPCGPLGLKAPKVSNITDPAGIHFLGNQGYWENKEIRWEPDFFAMEKIMKVIEEPRDVDEIISTIEWLQRWRRGYPLWSNGEAAVARYTAQLGARLALAGASPLSERYRLGLGYLVEACQTLRSETGDLPDLVELLPDFVEADTSQQRRLDLIGAVNLRLGASKIDIRSRRNQFSRLE